MAMAAPLISPELFSHLRLLAIQPYARLDTQSCKSLSEGARIIVLASGDVYSTATPGLRVTVLSGSVRYCADNRVLDLHNTREHVVLTQSGENRFIAEERTMLLMAETELLDTLSSWNELAEHIRDSGGDELASRLSRVTHCVSFRRLPLEHVETALRHMTPQLVKAGETIIRQGERGDRFYLIWSGRAEVWRTGIYDDVPARVAELGPGDTFGDEALVTGGNRNATVKMVEDGKLLMLEGEYFRELISCPLLHEVTPTDAREMLKTGWIPVDVRYAEEFEDGHIDGSIHLPLPDLRSRAEAVLDRNQKHVVVCLSGKRSAVGAYLLNQRGFNAVAMKEGITAWPGETVSGAA